MHPEAGNGISSEDRGHRHELMLVGGGVADPNVPFNPEDWVVLAAPDGHSHYPGPLTGKKEKVASKAEYGTLLELFQAQLDYEDKSMRAAEESEDMYAGDQWNAADKRKLESEDRVCLTINRVESLIDSLSGTMRQNKMDWKCKPVEGGDQKVADLCTLILKAIATENGLENEDVEVFDDSTIGGRGAYSCLPRYDQFGRIMLGVEWFPRGDFYCGPHLRKDLRDLKDMSMTRWYSPEQLRNEWPEHADDIPDFWDGPEAQGRSGNARENRYQPTGNPLESNVIDLERHRVRVVETWRKEFIKIPKVEEQGIQPEEEFGPAEARKASTIPGVNVDWVPAVRMRQQIWTAGLVLQDDYPKQPTGVTYPLHISYAHKRRNRWWGKVEVAKDPQREINKRTSQGMDILNKMAGYGWFYSRDMFPNDEEYEAFKVNASKAGFMAEVMEITRKPVKEEGTRPPSEVMNGLATSRDVFNEVTAWSMAWVTGSGEMSGDSISERQRNALLPNEFLFDNLRACKRRLGKAILAWVPEVYHEEDLARMVLSASDKTVDKIGDQPIGDFTMEDIVDLLSNKDLTRYDVVVSEDAWSPTTRMANFRLWSRVPNVPLPALIEMSDLPNKQKIIDMFNQQQQAQQQSEQAKNQTEIQKTLIAKGVDPNATGGQGEPQQ